MLEAGHGRVQPREAGLCAAGRRSAVSNGVHTFQNGTQHRRQARAPVGKSSLMYAVASKPSWSKASGCCASAGPPLIPGTAASSTASAGCPIAVMARGAPCARSPQQHPSCPRAVNVLWLCAARVAGRCLTGATFFGELCFCFWEELGSAAVTHGLIGSLPSPKQLLPSDRRTAR